MSGLLIATVALVSVLTGLGVVAVAQLGVLIAQLADLKAYVRTVISALNGDIDLGDGWTLSTGRRITQPQLAELRTKLQGTQ